MLRRLNLPQSLFAVALAGLAGAGAIPACATTATTATLAPITGIVVRADALIVGRGCGNDDAQIYRYVVVIQELGVIPGSGLTVNEAAAFPCYADGTFINLPTANYAVSVFAFNRVGWDASNAGGAIDAAIGATVPINDTTIDPAAAFQHLNATWTTTCSAFQQSNIEVLAVCKPLGVPGASVVADAGVTLDAGVTHDAGLTDAGVTLDAGVTPDAGVTVDTGAPSDAASASDTE